MPNILCPKPPSLCNDPADPLANISSEAPDGNDFTGRSGQLIWPAGYGGSGGGVPATADTFPDLDNTFPETWPPLGNQWTSSWCNGVCISDESQDAADLCAWNAFSRVRCQCMARVGSESRSGNQCPIPIYPAATDNLLERFAAMHCHLPGWLSIHIYSPAQSGQRFESGSGKLLSLLQGLHARRKGHHLLCSASD